MSAAPKTPWSKQIRRGCDPGGSSAPPSEGSPDIAASGPLFRGAPLFRLRFPGIGQAETEAEQDDSGESAASGAVAEVQERFGAVLQHIAKAFHVSAAASSPPSTPRSLAQAGEAASRFANVPWTDADAGPHKQQQKQQAGGEGGKGDKSAVADEVLEGAQLRRAPSFAQMQWQPSGESLAVAINSGTMEEKEGRGKPSLPSPCMSASGLIVAFFHPNKVQLWSMEQRQVTAELDLSQWGGRPRAAVFTVDGDVLVVSTKLGAITAWDVTKGALVAVLRGAGTANAPESIGWPGAHHLHAGPGVLVWSAHSRGHLRIWDTATWETRPLELGVPKDHLGRIISCQVSSNGFRLAALMIDAGESQGNNRDARRDLERQQGMGTIKVWDLRDGRELSSIVVGRCPEAAWFTKQLDRAALWFTDPSSRNGAPTGLLHHSSMSRLRSLSSGKFLRHGSGNYKRVASRSGSGVSDGDATELQTAAPFVRCVEVWELREGGEIEFVHEDISIKPVHCAFTVQGHRLAIQQDDLVSLWDMKQCIQLTVVPGSGPVVFSPDSRLLACSDPLRPVVVLWNVEAGTRLFELRCHDDEVLAVSAVARAEQDEEGPALQIEKIEFDVDSAHLLSTWAPDDSAVLWNIAPGAAFHKVAGRFGPNIQRRGDSCPDALLGWTPDAARAVVSRSHGRKLEFWDLQANVRLSSVEHADAPLIGLAFSDSGTTAVTVASDGTFCHWDLFNNGEKLGEPGVGEGAAQDVAFVDVGGDGGGGLAAGGGGGAPAAVNSKRLSRVEELQLGENVGGGGGRAGWRPSVATCCVCVRSGLAAQLLVDATLALVRIEDGQSLHNLGFDIPELRGHMLAASALAFASEGRRLLSSASDGSLVVWDTASGRPAFTVAQVAAAHWSGWTAPAAMPVSGLSACAAELSGSGRIFLHAKSVRVSPSGRCLAMLRFSCLERDAQQRQLQTEEGGAGALGRAVSGMSAVSLPGSPHAGLGTTVGRTLQRGLPLSFCAQYIEDTNLTIKCVTILCTDGGAERQCISADQICEQLPLEYGSQFQPTMCCWSGDSRCLALHGCRRGTPTALVFKFGGTGGRVECQPLLSDTPWTFSSVALSGDGSRLAATGEDPAIHSLFTASMMRSQVEQNVDAFTLPIQVWNTIDGSVMYSIRQHNGPITDLAFSSNDYQIMAASTSGVYTLTMGAAEGMHPDPHQLMELVGKEDLSNFYGDMGAAGSSAIHTLLEAYPMLPNHLDAEGRNLITLAAQRNQEGLMYAVLGCPHAADYGLKGAGFHLNAMAAALKHSPACVSLLMKALMANLLRPHSSATCIPEVLRGLLKKFPGEIVSYLGSHGVTDLGAFLISSNVGNLEKGMVTTASPYFFVQRPQLLWRGLVEEMEEAEVGQGRQRRRGLRHKGRKREPEIPAVARVVTIPGCCLPGQRGLLQALLHYPTVPTEVWGLPIVQAVIAFKWRKFGRRYVIWEFVFYLLWLSTYTIFMLLLPSVQTHAEELATEGGPGGSASALYGTSSAVCASLFLCLSFCITIRNVISEGKQVLAAGVKEWASSPWNIVDMLSLMLWLCLLPLYFTQAAPVHLNPLVAFNSILMWSKLLYFALAFESTSALVRMVLEILVDMKHFLLLLVTVMIGFGCAFFVVFSGYGDPDDPDASFNQFSDPLITMFTMYSMMLGYFDTAQLFASAMPATSITLFVIYELMVVIILLNLLIAIMGDSFDKVRETEHLQFMRGRASVIDGIETTLSREQLQNKDWFPEGYIHILQRRYDEGDQQSWMGRVKAIEQAQEVSKREILAAVERAVEETRSAMRDEMAAKFEELSAQLSALGGGTTRPPSPGTQRREDPPPASTSPLLRAAVEAIAASRSGGSPLRRPGMSMADAWRVAARRSIVPTSTIPVAAPISRPTTPRALPSSSPRHFNSLVRRVLAHQDGPADGALEGVVRANPLFASRDGTPRAEEAAERRPGACSFGTEADVGDDGADSATPFLPAHSAAYHDGDSTGDDGRE